MNLEQALDHAHLVGDCVSTSAKALKRLAEEVEKLQEEVNKSYRLGYDAGYDDGFGYD